MAIEKINLTLTFDTDRNFLTIAIAQQPNFSEGQSLLAFTGQYTEEICRAAIAFNIRTVQAVCGAIEYMPFEPAKVLPLLILNEKLQSA
jgi:hypothetical protein